MFEWMWLSTTECTLQIGRLKALKIITNSRLDSVCNCNSYVGGDNAGGNKHNLDFNFKSIVVIFF